MIAYQLTQEKRDLILGAIRNHFETQKPYLKHGYSLRTMAEELNITYTYLSYIINREYGMNFNDLVNKYRIRHLQELMKDDTSHLYTLEGLAYQSGFNSRSTFYRAFYKSTGRMPSAYVKEMQEAQVA
jgi:AraC-like DNA-binding protein